MKELPRNQISNLDAEEVEQIQTADLAIARAVKRRRLDLVYMVKSQKYAAIRIAERQGPYRFIHLTTAFVRTEFGPNEPPRDQLEIKVDADNITDDSLIESTKDFINTLPNLGKTKINIFASLQDYRSKKPAVTFVSGKEIAA